MSSVLFGLAVTGNVRPTPDPSLDSYHCILRAASHPAGSDVPDQGYPPDQRAGLHCEHVLLPLLVRILLPSG